MTGEISLSAARRWFIDLWSEGNLDVADEIIAPNYAPDWVQIPKKGPEQVKHEVRYFRGVFPDLQYTIVDSAAFPEKVWVRYKGTGTQKGAAWGFEPTNKQVEFEGATIFTIDQNGQISNRWGAFCIYDIFADLGLVPPFWELNQLLRNKP
ncbi:MAG: ester cyclase [Ardenticatenaceae bacterium]|nr:ester cyclase [Ardenticatenaceae bacterium]MCB9445790.1 ester cyclase [Ardenticatenaceae bacterium]